jgi:hypothetical protein
VVISNSGSCNVDVRRVFSVVPTVCVYGDLEVRKWRQLRETDSNFSRCCCACKYVCMRVCMYACMRACVHVNMYVCVHACVYVCVYVRMYVRTYVRTVCTYVYMDCMYVCM